MTETEVKLSQLQKTIAHLAELSDDGWVLKWGDTPQTAFEIVCRKASVAQIQKLEATLDSGYQKATHLFNSAL